MQNEMVKRLMWQGLMMGMSALVGIIANRTAAAVWQRVFDEEPPE
jgi:hypothetical protein